MTDLITVIVPVYNVENYLHQCLDSILAQTYQNWELLLVNDGSTDKSGAICDDYAVKDERIKVFHQENQGVSAARNYGIDHSKGAYLCFVDSDDGIHEKFLEDLYENAQLYQADVVTSNYFRYQEDNQTFYFHNKDKDDLVLILQPEEAVLAQLGTVDYLGNCMVFSMMKLFRRHLFEELRFQVGAIIEDDMLIHKLYLLANKVVVVNKNYYMYRVRPGSLTTSAENALERISDHVRALEIKLTDIVLAGFPTELMVRKFRFVLRYLKLELERYELTDTQVYQLINQRLKWLEKREDIS